METKRKENIMREGIYVGESSWSLHERSVEHIRDAKGFSKKSHIVKHSMSTHPEKPQPPLFSFTITNQFVKADCGGNQDSTQLRQFVE